MARTKKDIKRTSMTEKKSEEERPVKVPFHQKNFMMITTTICAIFGALMGGWYSCNQIFKKDKPKFEFMSDGVIVIDSIVNGNRHTFFLIIGTVSNDGQKTLFPAGYKCEISDISNGTSFNLDTYFPDSTLKSFPLRSNIHQYDSIINQNLSLRKIVSPHDAVYGNLLFRMKGHINIMNIKWKFKISCTDIHNKKYYSFFEQSFSNEGQNRKPRMGITGYGIKIE